MAIPKEHIRRFHGMDDAKEIWEAIRTRFGGNANSKKMQKVVFKQQFEAFKISNSEGLEKGYDRFQQLLSQLETHGAEVSTEEANHKFLRSLPPAWSNLAMTIRTSPEIDNLSIDDLYNNLRVFEQEIQDWDLIRAKIEANAELSKSMLGSELQGEDFAKKMVDLVNQRKKYFLKNLSFEEVKEEFDKLVKQVESFAQINFEATKASLKRFGEELQTKTPKRLKDDEAKDDELTKKSGKRRKQMARRGLHT
ncbi:hypothetical protein Tco_1042362, partial [Tanacetum coccineum]